MNVKVIECTECDCEVELLHSWANQCDECGKEYNSSGQQLADRIHWGEETGEDSRDLSLIPNDGPSDDVF